jgi:Domain of unknown function (DUF4440)
MRRILLTLLFVCVIAPAAIAQSTTNPNSDSEAALVDSVHKWLTAQAALDRKTMEQLIDPKFIGTAFGTNVLTRSDILPEPGQDPGRWSKATLTETTTRVFGDTGIVMGGISFGGADPDIRFTLVYQKESNVWRMIAAHLAHPPNPG